MIAAACGESPGGSGYGGDTTPPVTTVDTPSGIVLREQEITFTCTDNSSGCRESWLSAEESGNPDRYMSMYDADVSGSSTIFSVEISGSHTAGVYDYKFYSIDNANNTESVKIRIYTIQ